MNANFLLRMLPVAMVIIMVGAVSLSTTPAMPAAAPQPAFAQDDGSADTCLQIVRNAMQAVGSACASIGTNEACYGNNQVLALDLDSLPIESFRSQGDLIGLDEVLVMATAPYLPQDNIWGVALMSLQADLPEDSTERVTYMLLGDTQIVPDSVAPPPPTICSATNNTVSNINVRSEPVTGDVVTQLAPGATVTATGRTADGWLRVEIDGETAWVAEQFFNVTCDGQDTLRTVGVDEAEIGSPMQVIRVNSGQAVCDDAPSGLLIRSPQGQTVNLVINGVEMAFSSAGFIESDAAGNMNITGIEGEIVVRLQPGAASRSFDEIATNLGQFIDDLLVENRGSFGVGTTLDGGVDSNADPDELADTDTAGATEEAQEAVEPGPDAPGGDNNETSASPTATPEIAEVDAAEATEEPPASTTNSDVEDGPPPTSVAAEIPADESDAGGDEFIAGPPEDIIVVPGVTLRITVGPRGTFMPASEPDVASQSSLLPVFLDVATEGSDFDSALIESTGDLTEIEDTLENQTCTIGEVLTVDLPLPDVNADIDPIVAITFPEGDSDTLLVSRRDTDTLQINCLSAGTQVVVITVADEDGQTESLGVLVTVTAGD